MQKIDLNPFRKYLISRIKKGVVNGQKLYLEIKDQGFEGSYETLYRYLRNELGDHWINQVANNRIHCTTNQKPNPKGYAWRKLFIREVNLQGNKLVNIYSQAV